MFYQTTNSSQWPLIWLIFKLISISTFSGSMLHRLILLLATLPQLILCQSYNHQWAAEIPGGVEHARKQNVEIGLLKTVKYFYTNIFTFKCFFFGISVSSEIWSSKLVFAQSHHLRIRVVHIFFNIFKKTCKIF